MLKKTTAQSKIAALKERVRIIQGGTASSKTFSILALLIDYAIKKPMSEISVVSESVPHLRRGSVKDFQKIMVWCGMFQDAQFNKSTYKYTFSNGSYIEFFSADQPDKLRGARRHVLFINECNNISFEAYLQLAIRTTRFIYLDYNPTAEFWVHTELEKDDNSKKIVLTYKDNEALDKVIVQEIEKAEIRGKTSSYWANWWRVYGLGLVGAIEGVVFSNWKPIDSIPEDARLVGIGMDFGYTNDPSAIVEVYKYNDKRILNEICYQTGLLNSDLAKRLPKDVPIYADSAEPKSIAEIALYGHSIKGVKKGADSIVYGIDVMQRQDYLVTKHSYNLIKELQSYSWDKDRQGKQMNKPIDNFNHALDAVRYHEMMTLGLNRNYGKYSIL